MTLFLLSLTGIPPLAGFWAKAYVILAAIQAGGWLTALAVLAMLNAAAAAFYYLRVVVYMYMREPAEERRTGITRHALPGRAGRHGHRDADLRAVPGARHGRQQRRERLPRLRPARSNGRRSAQPAQQHETAARRNARPFSMDSNRGT